MSTFIKLNYEVPFFINHKSITAIQRESDTTIINTTCGHQWSCKETPDEILKLIEKAQNPMPCAPSLDGVEPTIEARFQHETHATP